MGSRGDTLKTAMFVSPQGLRTSRFFFKSEPRKKTRRREPSQKEIKVDEVETSLPPEESLGTKVFFGCQGLFLPQGFVWQIFLQKKYRG